MPAAYLGGHEITGVRWIGFNAIAIEFASSHVSRYTQAYAGRQLIGVTGDTDSREVVAELVPSEWPQHLSLVSVLSENRFVDFGATLPDRPYNRAKITVNAASYPADAQRIEFTGGTEAGGAVDDENVLGEVLLSGDGDYVFLTDPLSGSGEWNFEAIAYDSRDDDGNPSDPLEVSATVVSYPPDIVFNGSGNRLTVAVDSQVLTVGVTLP